MITEEDFLVGREMARRRESRYSSPLKELVFAFFIGNGLAFSFVLAYIYLDRILGFFTSILKLIWL